MISPQGATSKRSQWLNGRVEYKVRLCKEMAAELEIQAKETKLRKEDFIAEAVEALLATRRLERMT